MVAALAVAKDHTPTLLALTADVNVMLPAVVRIAEKGGRMQRLGAAGLLFQVCRWKSCKGLSTADVAFG